MNTATLIAPPSGVADTTQNRWWPARVLALKAWTPRLCSFRLARPEGFNFVAGHYARLGIATAGTETETLWRPFSMVSGTQDRYLEFIAVLIPDGPFSTRLAALAVGDTVLVDKLCFGFLTLSQLAPGRKLWLLASGSGVGPFLSILREAAPWQAFDHIVVAHSVRQADELAYRDDILALGQEYAAAGARAMLHYLPVVTRESCPGALAGRIPELIATGRLQQAAGIDLDVADSRVMACGNPDLTRDLRALLAARGFAPNRRGALGQMAFEKYW